jgi:hypothetical protein
MGVRHTGNRLGQVVIPLMVGLVAGTSVGLVFASLTAILSITTFAVLTTKFDRYPPSAGGAVDSGGR